jgi:hypothetical protein
MTLLFFYIKRRFYYLPRKQADSWYLILNIGLLTLLSNFTAHEFVWGHCIGLCTGIE